MKNKLVSELKEKIETEKQVERNKKIEQRCLYAKIKEDNQLLREKMNHQRILEKEKDKKFIEDF